MVSKQTIIRTIILGVALLNQLLTSKGLNPLPFSDDIIYETATIFVTIVASAVAWWKNNSFTQGAIEGDKVMYEFKNGK